MRTLLILIIIFILGYCLLDNTLEKFSDVQSEGDKYYFKDDEIYYKYGNTNIEYSRFNVKTKEVKHWYARQTVDKVLKNKKNKKVLVLGVSLGGIIVELLEKNKNMEIVGVDIEDTHFDIVRKYSDNNRLKLYKSDAKDFVIKMKDKYDVIIVDLFIGDKVPKFVTKNKRFMKKLNQKLNTDGLLLINTIGIKQSTLELLLKKNFRSSRINIVDNGSNFIGIVNKK